MTVRHIRRLASVEMIVGVEPTTLNISLDRLATMSTQHVSSPAGGWAAADRS